MQVEFHYSEGDYADACELLAGSVALWRRAFSWLALPLVVGVNLITSDVPLPFELILLSVASTGSWLINSTFVLRWRAQRSYRKLESLQAVAGAELDETGIKLLTPHGDGKLKWSGVVRWLEGPRTILVYPQPGLVFILPKSAFSPSQLEQLRTWLKELVGPMGRQRSLKQVIG